MDLLRYAALKERVKRITLVFIAFMFLGVEVACAATFINPASGAVNEYQRFGTSGYVIILLASGTHTWQDDYSMTWINEMVAVGESIVVYNPDGRGASGGVENYWGDIHQRGLKRLIEIVSALPGVAPPILQAASYSGTGATAVLARWPTLPIRALVLAESPADRYDSCPKWGYGCNDPFWESREAASFMANVQKPVYIFAGEPDHAQPDHTHITALNDLAVGGVSPWVCVNECYISGWNTLDTVYGGTTPVLFTAEGLANYYWPYGWSILFSRF